MRRLRSVPARPTTWASAVAASRDGGRHPSRSMFSRRPDDPDPSLRLPQVCSRGVSDQKFAASHVVGVRVLRRGHGARCEGSDGASAKPHCARCAIGLVFRSGGYAEGTLMCRLAALALVVFAATLGWPARADILIGMAGPDDRCHQCLVRRAGGARRGAGRGRHQRRRRRARPAGAADHGGRFLRSRAGGRRRQEAGQRRCDLRRRTLLLRTPRSRHRKSTRRRESCRSRRGRATPC